MLLIANETIRSNPSLINVVREMSFAMSSFASTETLSGLLAGKSRRIVLLTESDVSDEVVELLQKSSETAPVGVVVAADRDSVRSSSQAAVVDCLANLDNVEWVGARFDFDKLSTSARRCRRRMLRVSQQEVEDALENGQFVLRYQPKVERGGTAEWLTREAEALIRWQHPEHGLMGPLEFLPEVEAFGQMGKLSEFVLQTAAAQLVSWNERGIRLNSCINLASSQLGDPQLADTYETIVTDLGLECSRFTFEVVERDLANPNAPHLQMLNALRKKGFRICLDDFRIAASSLATFERLPFDEIKIHASALKRAQHDRVSSTVLAAVTGLAHNLGMSVCAEGVEDQEAFDFLTTIECDKMQGFLISEAVIPSIIRRVYSTVNEGGNSEEVA